MNSLLVGLGLILVGIYFSSIIVSGFGLLCIALGLYSGRSMPVREPERKEVRKTKHTVVMGEPPETQITPAEMKRLPVNLNEGLESFLPLPDYGYSNPLERVLLGFPIKFWKR